MSVLVLVEVTVHPDKVEAARARYEEILPDTRAFEGCESVTVHVDQDAPGALVLVQRWASREHYRRYAAWRASRPDDVASGQALSTGAPTVARVFDDLDA